MRTNWKKIGLEIGSITEDLEAGGDLFAQKAIEQILGEEWIKDTVGTALSTEPGSELAMNCLRYISSERAADYAYSIYKSDPNVEKKRMSVWLIKSLAVKKSYRWIEEFLNDPNVLGWGIGVLDQLLWCEKIDYEDEKARVDHLLDIAIKNSNGALKEQVEFIKNYLEKRRIL